MKKFLAAIIISLLWGGNAYSELYDFKNCYPTKTIITDDTGKITEIPGARSWSQIVKGSEGGVIDIVWTVNIANGIVTETIQYSPEHVKKINNRFKDLKNAEDFLIKTIMQNPYQITNAAAGIITAAKIKRKGVVIERWKILVEGKSGKVTSQYTKEIGNNTSTTEEIIQCEVIPSSEEDSSGSSGTAFFINSKGYLLTNHHVIDGCKEQKINYGEKEIDVKIIASDKSLDLALLKADVRPKSYISVTNSEPKKRQKVIAAGYPLGKFLSDDLKINDGRISALKGFEDNSFQIQHDIPINPGNSGGPIVNEDGELVAIAVSGMSKEITEGLNFGIKVSAVKNFLSSNKIKASSSFMSLGMNDDKLVDLLEKSTVYTFCE